MNDSTAIKYEMHMDIIGVEIKDLITHPDQRGFFREIIRVSDPFFSGGAFGQWSHSRMTKDVVKAWHYHHVQTDWWYVGIGEVETVLFDNRPESPSYKQKMVFRMGDGSTKLNRSPQICVRIPPGVLHGCKVISDEAHLFYITSHTYNANEEGRFPYNSDLVRHDWGSQAIVAENDKRTFVPTSLRQLI